MIKNKTYHFDDEFKRVARAYQFYFRENELGIYYDEKNPQVMLTPEAAKAGLIFYEGYRDLIHDKIGKFGNSALFSNMLRSEHIPYNIFAPMELDKSNAVDLLNKIINGSIARINEIKIEFAGKYDRINYLDDRTSFDAYVEYESTDGLIGGIGIEVKYTENGYSLGSKEKKDIENSDGYYKKITKKSSYFIEEFDITQFIKDNNLRQIWRNHILGYAMINNGDIIHFHHIHLYPKGNIHFHEHTLPEYKKLLTDRGKESFVDITYEELFELMSEYFTSTKQIEWIYYLRKRYLISM